MRKLRRRRRWLRSDIIFSVGRGKGVYRVCKKQQQTLRDVGNNWNAPLICLFEIVFENMFWFLASVQAQNNNNENNSRNNSNNNNYIANSSLLYGSSAVRAFRQCACRVVAAAPSNVGVIAGLARPRVRVSCCCFSLGTLSCRCGSGFVVRS